MVTIRSNHGNHIICSNHGNGGGGGGSHYGGKFSAGYYLPVNIKKW